MLEPLVAPRPTLCASTPMRKIKTFSSSDISLSSLNESSVISPSGKEKVTIVSQEELDAYDEYLMSELMKVNSKKSKEKVQEAVEKDLMVLTSATIKLIGEYHRVKEDADYLESVVNKILSAKDEDLLNNNIKNRFHSSLKNLAEGVENSADFLVVNNESQEKMLKELQVARDVPDVPKINPVEEELSKTSERLEQAFLNVNDSFRRSMTAIGACKDLEISAKSLSFQ